MLELTKYLSIYAAVLSTIVFLWNVRQARSTFRVRLAFAFDHFEGETVPGLLVDIQNPSSHAVHLVEVSFLTRFMSGTRLKSILSFFRSCDPLSLSSGIEMRFPPSLVDSRFPASVPPGASHTIFVPCITIEKHLVGLDDRRIQVAIRDALGRRRYSPKYVFPAQTSDEEMQVAAA